ncbi:DUF5686 and carboxypeptidase regulatory-like domain-containing protein [Halosquirtibacter xylanolyticus]|uniref:DUF5686 and carboxypeptidase-like regulatory domain-containing protein n=1 Tax=Halosquirtibacter xylanolyticus TaxID=3374599 RepID=UPI0037483F87|nr:DUF5686 and carboxypeptidase regulatory-like domain-containing protein [Prolixibacteraceae bacterium]
MLKYIILLTTFLYILKINGQQYTRISGIVIDKDTKDPLPLVNLQIKGSNFGTTTNNEGEFKLSLPSSVDTIIVSAIGYKTVTYTAHHKVAVLNSITIQLTSDIIGLSEVKVTPKENPALQIIRNISKHRKQNDPNRISNISYNSHTKMMATITNLSKFIRNNILFRNHQGIFIKNDDSLQSRELPVLLIERDDYFFRQENPEIDYHKKIKEEKRALDFMNEMDINLIASQITSGIDLYRRQITLFSKQLLNPVHQGSLNYYHYHITDSLYTDNGWVYTISFVPKQQNSSLFSGQVRVIEDSWALLDIELILLGTKQINLINNLKFHQSYASINDSTMFCRTKRLDINFELFDKKKSFLAPKEKIHFTQIDSYGNVHITDRKVTIDDLKNEHLNQPLVAIDSIYIESNEIRDRQVANSLDSLNNHWLVKTGNFFAKMNLTGYIEGKYIDFGPYNKWISQNKIEGLRLNANFRTSEGFIKNTMVTGQIGYGFTDNKIKYATGVTFKTNPDKWRFISLNVKDDFVNIGDNGDVSLLNENTRDQIDYSLVAREEIDKLVRDQEVKLGVIHEWKQGITSTLDIARHKTYSGLYVPFYSRNNQFIPYYYNNEMSLTTRFSWDQDVDQLYFQRYYFNSVFPVINFKCTIGNYELSDNQSGNYLKLRATYKHQFNIGLTTLKYAAEAGYLWGDVPFTLLEVHRGNPSFLYAYYNYNSMNSMEFASTQFANLFIDYHINGILLKHLPLIGKLDWRETVSAKILHGNLDYTQLAGLMMPMELKSLNNEPFVELGVGVGNIFQFLRVEGIYRATHQYEKMENNFGVRFRAEMSF